MEIWKDIKQYEGLYKISNYGRVMSIKRKTTNGGILKPSIKKSGYAYVRLCKNNVIKDYRVHRLVAQTFIKNDKGLKQINHKDENKLNNNVSNLEWCSTKYNMNYGTAIERRAKKQRKAIYQYDNCGNLIQKYDSLSSLYANYGYNIGHISACCHNKRKTAHGFIWSYELKGENNE